jgi:hypothetical protein
MRAKAEEEEEGLVHQGIPLADRVENEGDLFGLRALERGFTGGVAQAKPSLENLDGESTPPLTVEDVLRATKRIPYGKNSANPLFSQITGGPNSTTQNGSASGSGGAGSSSSASNPPPSRPLTPALSPASNTAAMQAAALLPAPPPHGERFYTPNRQYLRVPNAYNDGFIGGHKLRNWEKAARPPSPSNGAPTPSLPPRGLQDNAQNQGPEENARTPQDSGNEETMIPAAGNQYVRPYSWQLTSTRSMEILSVPASGTDQTLRLPFQPNHAHTTSSLYSAPQPGSLHIVIETPEISSMCSSET